MNQHIQALISQCPLRYNTHQSSETRQLELEKFARQVVAACIPQIYPPEFKTAASELGLNPANLEDAVTRVTEHFGIK